MQSPGSVTPYARQFADVVQYWKNTRKHELLEDTLLAPLRREVRETRMLNLGRGSPVTIGQGVGRCF